MSSHSTTLEQLQEGELRFELTASRQFAAWMAQQQVSLAFTTYQAGKLFLIGLQPNGRLSIFERLEGAVQELYDVVALAGVKRPMALGLKTDEIRRTHSVGEAGEFSEVATSGAKEQRR